ncbi:T9SS type A sorting domain-containing protein [Hymenobacter gummosus]|uniref:T9SS type A sorting domain-containing protein n=1 Tax=Hymenobacter gummosus TaxID=1776032 RepID=A0A3S0H3I9_9BACT|nr:T9SS type A sorting domain-containing protein [Hymenobacter gummosus]RTQ46548.1 T9SS type A sorting domain-containing protein [Hymenobacter gummosus]
MTNPYLLFDRARTLPGRHAPWYLLQLAWCWLALGPTTARAQAPAWSDATIGSSSQLGGTSLVRGIALDAAGNVFVTGTITGQVGFGSTVLTSAGTTDLFIAKYVPGTGTWAWAVRGGGTGGETGNSIAISGNSVYVTGTTQNNAANGNGVRFDTGSGTASVAVPGSSSGATNDDLIVAKYTDNGSSATLSWVQAAGGTGYDAGIDLAVSGTSVYVTGLITNSQLDASLVRFGGTTSAPGASTSNTRDIVVAKYTDNGASPSVSWVQVAGGTSFDQGSSIAVSGTSVYVTGYITNDQADASLVRFGGTAAQAGAHATSSRDIVVAKYTDNGASATFGWSQVGGGSAGDEAAGIAVSGTSVYVTGSITNTRADAQAVRFGGTGTTPGTAAQAGASTASGNDLVLAKYTDNGSSATFQWSQVGGGNQSDGGIAVTASGSDVYVSGNISNSTADERAVRFGGSGTTLAAVARPGASSVYSVDALIAKYTDAGSSATLDWTQTAGGSRQEYGQDLALRGGTLYVGGQVNATVTGFSFGAASTAQLAGTRDVRATISTLAAADGSWLAVASPAHGGLSTTRAVATDAAGNVFVTGSFSGQITFGSTVLTADGVGESGGTANDFFVAKYVPGTRTWAWALSGGGNGNDGANGIAVSGSSIYVTGTFFNSRTDANLVRIGGTGATAGTVPVNGVNVNNDAASFDLFLLKYTDNGTSATLAWNQIAGGYGNDQGYAVAVEGTKVYVTGHIHNNTTNSSRVSFGGSGTTAGSAPQYGASGNSISNNTDIVLAKYTDNGSSAAFQWSQVGGGRETDAGYGLAVATVSGVTSVYVVGQLTNNLSDVNLARFGGSGTTLAGVQQNGASTNGVNSGTGNDLVLAKYTDNGTTGTFGWSQVGGGTVSDAGYGVAVSGTSVYVTGFITNTAADGNAVRFGGAGTTPGTAPVNGTSGTSSPDLVLAKYTDNGTSATLRWTQTGGGSGADGGAGVAVDNTGVYVTGFVTNDLADANAVRFGGNGTTAGTFQQAGASSTSSRDLVVARYTDLVDGSINTARIEWAQAGGGAGPDEGYGLTLRGTNVYVVGTVVPAATFNSFVLSAPIGSQTDFLGLLPTNTVLPVVLTDFTAAPDGPGAVRLAWATAQEENSAAFEVERSLDGRTFARVGRRAAAGHSTSPRHYHLLDENLPAGAPLLYYRLRQIDQDGTFSYSEVRAVRRPAADAPALAVYPNPAAHAARLSGAAPGAAVQVVDVLGRVVLAATADAAGQARLVLPAALPAGVYIVRSGAQTGRLVKQ